MSEFQIDNGTSSSGIEALEDQKDEVDRRGLQSAGDSAHDAPSEEETSATEGKSKQERADSVSATLNEEIVHCGDHEGSNHERKDRLNRRGLMVCSSLFTFFYVGSFFGWGPMQLLLEENGAFRWKCDPDYDPEDVCPAQTSTLLNVQLIASVTQLVSPIMGQAIDHYGAPKCACFASGCVVIGLLLLTLASEIATPAWDRVLFAANGFLAMTTWMGGQLTVQVGMYFAGHTKSRAIFLLNSLFDGGSVTYLILWWLAQVGSLSLTAVAGGYLVFGGLLSVASLYFWYAAVPEHDEEAMLYGIVDRPVESHTDVEEETAGPLSSSPSAQCAPIAIVDDNAPQVANDGDAEEAPISGAPSRPSADLSAADDLLTSNAKDPSRPSKESEDSTKHDARRSVSFSNVPLPSQNNEEFGRDQRSALTRVHSNAAVPYVLVANRSVKQQLLSQPYLLLCLFFSLHVTMNMWTLATMRDFLAYLGDDELDNRYLTIFTLLLPASIIAVPLVDFIVLRFGFAGGFQSINVLALGYSIIRLATTNLNVQIVGFALFSFYRCFLFGITFSFLPQLVKSTLVGKGYGLVFLLTGIVNVIQIPLAHLAVQRLGGNFFIPNLVFTILIVPCIAAAWGLGRCIQRESTAKERLRASYGGGLIAAVEKLDSTGPSRQP